MERDPKGSKTEKAPKSATAPRQAAPRQAAQHQADRARGGEARMIGDLMPAIGRTAFRRFGFVQSSVVTRWPEIIGAAQARNCAPESIRFPIGEKSEGTLHLVVSPGHAPIIQHVIPEIIDRVNRFFGYRAVAQVRMRQGAVQVPGTREVRKAPPTFKSGPIELGDSLRDIGDPELRTVLESLARSLDLMSGKQG